jgi:hypothetical protein
MKKFKSNHPIFVCFTSLAFIAAVNSHAQSNNALIETQSLRCSALNQIHSTLTDPSPQLGEVMGELAGLFAQIHATQKSRSTKTKINTAELRTKRDELITEMSKGWPVNKPAMIREAALCDTWRAEFFSKLPERPSEKDLLTAMNNISSPPTTIQKTEIDRWTKLTPQAFEAWSRIKSFVKEKK